MRDFFRGWKRKLGVVTLLMTCALMAGWVRSYSFCDEVAIPDNRSTYFFHSMIAGFCWGSVTDSDHAPDLLQMHYQTFRLTQTNVHDLREIWALDPCWRWAGFRFEAGPSRTDPSLYYSAWFVPYWSIVLPLTLLSAWLLLSKPCQPKRADLA